MTKLAVTRNVRRTGVPTLPPADAASIMTTPVERMRALRFGREMLEILLQDLSMRSPLCSLADVAQMAYPTADQWIDLLNQRGKPLPPGLASAVRSVRQLLVDARVLNGEDDEFQAALRRTLWHFPSISEIEAWCRSDAIGDIRSHLAHETEWDRRAIAVRGPLRLTEMPGQG